MQYVDTMACRALPNAALALRTDVVRHLVAADLRERELKELSSSLGPCSLTPESLELWHRLCLRR